MRVKHFHFILFLLVLVVVTGLAWSRMPSGTALLVGFDAAGLLFCGLTLHLAANADPERLRKTAARNDAGRGVLLLIGLLLLLVVLTAVAVEVVERTRLGGAAIALVVATLVIAWLFGNLLCARHYAHLFYDSIGGAGDCQGLIFPGTNEPDLWDLIYFAIVIGMTFQVSDVQIASARMRRAATFHSIAAFFFNIGIVALSVNLVASAA